MTILRVDHLLTVILGEQKKMRNALLAILGAILLISCASSVNVLKPEGELISLQLSHNAEYRCELLAVDDTAIFFKYQEALYKIALENFQHVYISGYSLRNSKGAAMTFLVALDVLFAAGGADPGWIVASAAHGAIAILSVFIGDPQVDFSSPLEPSDLEKLRLYCRYPQGLTDEQWHHLLASHQQEDFLVRIE